MTLSKSRQARPHKFAVYVLLVTACLSPAMAAISGLVLAPVLGIFGMLVAASVFSENRFSAFRSHGAKLLILLLIWALFSTAWSLSIDEALANWVRLIALCIAGMLCIQAAEFTYFISEYRIFLARAIVYGLCIALVFMVMELLTGGHHSKMFRMMISGGSDATFLAHYLNRGACYIALLAWPFFVGISMVMERSSRVVVASMLLLWITIAGTLVQLESLSATLAYFVASLVFAVLYLTKGFFYTLLTGALVSIIILTPILTSSIHSDDIATNYPALPKSAIHRLYIWEFSAQQALDRPLGWGFDASRRIPGGSDRITRDGQILDPNWAQLPLHPHNHVMQIWLEMGIVGIIIFALFIIGLMGVIRSKVKTIGIQSACAALVSAYFIIGMTGFGVWQYWWVAAGFLSGAMMTGLVYAPTPVFSEKARARAQNS